MTETEEHIVMDFHMGASLCHSTKSQLPFEFLESEFPSNDSEFSELPQLCVALSESQDVGTMNACVCDHEEGLIISRASRIFIQKLTAEAIGTFILVFAGCGSVVVDEMSEGQVTHVGISIAFGVVVTILIYTVGHISGCHVNPAVTIALASVGRFKWRLVPSYILAQVAGAISAASTLYLILGSYSNLGATLPTGSNIQSLVLETIITFILMFVVMGSGTDTQSISQLGGIAVGATVALNALFAGPICGASMNPARSIGPAIVGNTYTSLWIYIVGPIVGAILGAWTYEFIRTPKE